tara:strand:- start:2003 stop:2239 length:237 start_codon:yes stop_codon:yes gene_type:complete
MSGLKKLTEQDYRELNSMRNLVFDRFNEGTLVPSKYDALSSRVSEMRREYEVSEFETFLSRYRSVYEMRKEESSISLH